MNHTDEEMRAAYEEYLAGASVRTVARAHGVTNITLYRRWQQLGLELRSYPRIMTDDEIRAAYERYAAGASVEEIARESGVSSATLYKQWQRLGLELRSHPRIMTDDEIRAAYERYAAGASVAGIARETGVNSATLYKRWQRLGLELHPRQRAYAYTDDEMRAAYERYAAGLSVEEIARESGIRSDALYRYWQRLGLAVRPYNTPRRYSDEEIRALYDEYQAGATMDDLEIRYGITCATLQKRWDKLGLARRPHSRNVRRVNGSRPSLGGADVTEAIAQKHAAGVSTGQLAQEYGCSLRTIGNRLRDWHALVRSETALSEEELRAAYEEYMHAGVPMAECEAKYGLTRYVMLSRWAQLGLPTRRAAPRRAAQIYTEDELRAMHDEYMNTPGASMRSMADKYGMSIRQLQNRWVRLGLMGKPMGGVPRPMVRAEDDEEHKD